MVSHILPCGIVIRKGGILRTRIMMQSRRGRDERWESVFDLCVPGYEFISEA